MATQALVNELADALVLKCIERLKLKLDAHRLNNFGLNVYHLTEFMTKPEWLLLKKAYKVDEDSMLIERVMKLKSFQEHFRRQYSYDRFELVVSPGSNAGYCVVVNNRSHT